MLARSIATLFTRTTAALCALLLVTTQLQAQQAGTITVPAGTVIPATLVSPIHVKSTKVGDPIRAQVAFPVTVGTQLAIPVGTFIEGVLEAPPAATKKDKHPLPLLHFTRLVFADGSTAPLDAAPQSALVNTAPLSTPAPATVADNDAAFVPTGHGGGSSLTFALAPQQSGTSTANPFAHSGPNPAVFYGPLVAAVVLFVLFVFARKHVASVDSVRYAPGYQFNLTLSAPLTVDAAHVNSSATLPVH